MKRAVALFFYAWGHMWYVYTIILLSRHQPNWLPCFVFINAYFNDIYLFICVWFARLKHQWPPIWLQVGKLLPRRGQNSPAEYGHWYVNLYLYLIFIFEFIFNCITTVGSTNSHHWLSLARAIKCMQKYNGKCMET